jgi:hypothetical protein
MYPPWVRAASQRSEHEGFAAAQQLVRDIVSGRLDPKAGHAVVLA